MDFKNNYCLGDFKKENLFGGIFDQFDENMHEDLIFGDSGDYKLSYSNIGGEWEDES